MKHLNFKNTYFLIIFILCLFHLQVKAQIQPGAWKWMDKIGSTGINQVHAISIDGKNDLFVAGNYGKLLNWDNKEFQSEGKQDIFLAVFNDKHRLKWIWTAGTEGQDYCTALTQSPGGELIIAGSLAKSGIFNKEKSNDPRSQLFFASINQRGKLQEYSTIPFTGNASIEYIQLLPDDILLAAGTYSDTLFLGEKKVSSRGKRDVFILRQNINGTNPKIECIASPDDEAITAFQTDSSGNLYLSLSFDREVYIKKATLGNNKLGPHKRAALISLDPNFNIRWSYSESSDDYFQLNAIAITNENQLYIGGVFSNNLQFIDTSLAAIGQTDIFLAKLTSNGKLLWAKTLGSMRSEYGGYLLPDPLGGVYLSGAFNDTLSADSTQLPFNGSYSNSFLAHYRKNGRLLLLEQIESEGNNLARSMALDKRGRLYLGGEFKESIKTNLVEFKSDGNTDVYVAQYENCIGEENLILGSNILCPGEQNVLEIIVKPHQVTWVDTIFDQTRFTITSPGKYWVKVVDEAGCVLRDTIAVRLADEVFPLLGNDTILDIADKLLLQPKGTYQSYLWQDNSLESSFMASALQGKEGKREYSIYVTDSLSCAGTDTLEITFVDKYPWANLSDAKLSITPNPTQNELNWSLTGVEEGKLYCELIDPAGNLIYNNAIQNYKEGISYSIPLQGYKPGVYYLQVSNQSITLSIAVIKE